MFISWLPSKSKANKCQTCYFRSSKGGSRHARTTEMLAQALGANPSEVCGPAVVLKLWISDPSGGQVTLSQGSPKTIKKPDIYVMIHNSGKIIVME